jgi:hypothetical protein
MRPVLTLVGVPSHSCGAKERCSAPGNAHWFEFVILRSPRRESFSAFSSRLPGPALRYGLCGRALCRGFSRDMRSRLGRAELHICSSGLPGALPGDPRPSPPRTMTAAEKPQVSRKRRRPELQPHRLFSSEPAAHFSRSLRRSPDTRHVAPVGQGRRESFRSDILMGHSNI